MRLVEGFVGVAILGAVACLAAGAASGCQVGQRQKDVAEAEARDFAHATHFKLDSLYCADRANRHGWVPCSIGDGHQLRPIECRGAWTLGSTCRDRALVVAPAAQPSTE